MKTTGPAREWSLTASVNAGAADAIGLERLADGGWTTGSSTLSLIPGVPDGGLMLRRDDFSSDIVFYAATPEGWAVSNSWSWMLAWMADVDCPREADLDFVKAYLRFQSPLTSWTPLAAVRRLGAGESVTLRPLPTTPAPEMRGSWPFPAGDPAGPENVREILAENLAALADRRPVFHISSGLDSTLLALLFARLVAPEPVALATCITRGRGPSNERSVVERFATDMKADLKVHDFTNVDIFEVAKEYADTVISYPAAHPSHIVEYMLDRCIAQTTGDIVSGTGPDEVLGGYQWHQPGLSVPAEHLARVTTTPASVLSALFPDAPDTDSQETFWNDRSFLSLRDRLTYDIKSLSEAWSLIYRDIENALDVVIHRPFTQPGLRAGLYAQPDAAKIGGGMGKLFLREHFADVYPAYLLEVPKVGLRFDLQPYLVDFQASDICDRILQESESLSAALDSLAVERMVNETLTGARNWGWQLWSLYLCARVFARMGV